MIKGPSTEAWTSTGFPVAARRNSSGVVTRRTPPDAVPIESLTKAGNRVQPSTSRADYGWGIPRRRRVADAEILSWTAASAMKEGMAVPTPDFSSRLLAHESTATCS